MTRYRNRWWWKTGIAAAGAGMFAGGVAWSRATAKEDEDGGSQGGASGGMVLGLTGIAIFAAPWLGWLDFLWDGMPKKALDTYNRNQGSRPPG
jgi:hypothetical protein